MTNILTSTTTLMSLVTKELKEEQLLKKHFAYIALLLLYLTPIFFENNVCHIFSIFVLKADICQSLFSFQEGHCYNKVLSNYSTVWNKVIWNSETLPRKHHLFWFGWGHITVLCSNLLLQQPTSSVEGETSVELLRHFTEKFPLLLLLYNINTVDKIAISVFPHNSECHLNDFVTQRFNLRVFPSVYK